MIRFTLIAFFILQLIQCKGQSQEDTSLEYHLKISKKAIRTVEVKAIMTLSEPKLEMGSYGIPPDIRKGWANFVTIKSLTDSNGNKIPYNWNSQTKQWKLNASPNTKIVLNYEVTLNHDSHQWDSVGGVDGRPTVIGKETAFWVTKALFIYPAEKSEKKSTIVFEVSDEWNISTAWTRLGSKKFLAQNLNELVDNALMIGKHQEQIIKCDDMTITMAVSSDLAHRTSLFSKTLRKILPIYRTIFKELPSANYLVCASKHFFEDGEAFYNSFHQMFVDKDLESRTIVWGNVFAHEMFHYWNGTNFLVGSNVNTNSWFSEGFTEYYANLALVRAGLISQEEYLDKLSFQFARFYSSQAFAQGDHPDLLEAGNQKARNWHLIYGGGASVAFILDIEIRAMTAGKKSLDDYMRALYLKFGKTHKPLDLEQQIEELNGLTGSDFQPFFDKYITGKQFYLIPILKACEKAGLIVAQYQGEFYLKTKAGPSLFDALIKEQ